MTDLTAALAKLHAMRAAQNAPAAPAAPATPATEPAVPAASSDQSFAARLLQRANATRTVLAAAEPAPTQAAPTQQTALLFQPPESPPELQERAPELVQAVHNLAAALYAAEPGLDNFLADIHKALRSEPELTHIMSDDQIAVVYQAQIAHSKIAVVPAKAKAPSKAKAAAAKAISDDDM